MLKILTEIDESQGFRVFSDQQAGYRFGGPCILSGASCYFEISLSDVVPNASGLDYLKMPFVFIPTLNIVKVPVAGVSPELSDMVPGILKEMQNSKILENMDLAIKAIDDFLPDPVPVVGEIIKKNYVSRLLPGFLGYYNLTARYGPAKKINNPWPGIHKITWFGQELYICVNLGEEDKCYLTFLSSPVENQELLVQLMNYKYAFKRYGIKTTSN